MPPDDLSARLLATFLDELDEQLRTLNDDLLALERTPDDSARLRSLFRVAHTLKGAARAAGVAPVEELCHALEGELAGAREGKTPVTAAQLALGFSAADALADASRRLRAGVPLPRGTFAPLMRSLHGRSAVSPGAESHETVPEAREARTGGLVESSGVAPPDHAELSPLEGADGAGPATYDTGPAPVEDELRTVTTAEESAVGAEPAAPAAASPQADEQLRVPTSRLDEMLGAAAEMLGVATALADRPTEVDGLRDMVGRWRAEWRRLVAPQRRALVRAGAPEGTLAAFDGVDGWLARAARELNELSRGASADARAAETTTMRLLDGARRLRQRPVSEIFELLPRAVRDLAVSLGKEVELELAGQDVEADRAVLDTLREPLLHLVRNAVDHGIESPEERATAGKAARATIRVAALLRGDRMEISVTDDGRGLDVSGIREALERRGRTVPTDARALARTVFEGGMSTRETATEISGRGVGLDIVRTTAARLGGTADVRWSAGEGTTFVIDVPVSVAMVRALLVRVSGHAYAIPTSFVERVARVEAGEMRQLDGRTVLPLGDEAPVPLASLARILGPPLAEMRHEGAVPVVVLRSFGRRVAIVVDELLEERSLAMRPLEHAGAARERFAGAALLREGVAAPVLRASALMAPAAAGLDLAHAAPAAPRRARLLVVDDSITTRTLEESVLAAAGYDVATAVDGEDAWRLIEEGGVELVVSDVEMPRLDGVALCGRIRASREHAELPVILVTSLDRPEQRAAGLEAGADAYITKSSFDQDTLLDTVRQLLGRHP